MKKILLVFLHCILLFCAFSTSAQSDIQDYLKLEKERIQKADSIEKDIKAFVAKNKYSFKLSASVSEKITKSLVNEHDGLDKPMSAADLKKALLQIKSDKLRDLYFMDHPKSQSYFTATPVQETLAITCVNGGFENGNTANYSFRSILASAIPIQHLEDGCSVINSSGSFNPSLSFNQHQDRATLVSSADEPFLTGVGININQVHSGNYALKIGPNPIDAPTLQIGNVTSVFRDFQIDANTIEFSFLHFGYVVPNFTHIQPFFRYRLYSINAAGNTTGILREVCIPMDFLDCRYEHAQDNRLGTNTLAYTPEWICAQMNTSNLVGQNVRLEFTVSDCEFRGHFSTVYIDDLCGTSCPPTWGAIHLNNININCPSAPFDVCGNFQLPALSTLANITLKVLNQSGGVIGTLTNPTINGQDFCFTVNPSIFGVNPIGNFTFQGIANLNSATTCISALTDLIGNVSYSSTGVTPTFTQIAPICAGDPMPNLPSVSLNGISGSWQPAVNNTDTTTYTFVASAGSCGTTAQMTIVVNPRITPTFNQVNAICEGSVLADLPILSNNNITGFWSPAINNAATTTYTFTPTSGLCVDTITMTIVVNPRVTPQFASVVPICYGDPIFILPLVSDNNVNGTWSPLFDNTHTANYSFTPDLGECAFPASLQLQVYEDFDFIYDGYCQDNDYYIKIVPLNNTFNPDTASYDWQVNNLSVGSASVLNISAYLHGTSIEEELPVVFDIKVTNSNGCDKIRSITVDNIFCGIQKGISVNNDDLNDYFDLRLLEVNKLTIFNRYGMIVYSKSDYYNEWKGQSNNGDELPDGVYYYVIEFKNTELPAKVGWIYINRKN
jgi:gliding motility-associated-like protein